MKPPVIFIFLFFSFACNSLKSEKKEQNKQQQRHTTEFEFKNEMHNFGELQAGEVTVFTFIFTNTSKNNLWINEAASDCGCVKVNYLEKPVKSGETGKIEVEFDS